MIVFLGHYSSAHLSGGLFWQFEPLGHSAVVVFFVLSGMVISYTADIKDNTIRKYVLSRVSRMYSVVIPALVLTIIADAIGKHFAQSLYSASWGYDASHPVLRSLATLTFTTQIWFLNWQPFSNGPFWSMPFEAWYYVLFGIMWFGEGRMRWVLAGIVALFIGPRILLLFPLWLLGVASYRMLSVWLSLRWAWVLFVGSTIAFVALHWLGAKNAVLMERYPDVILSRRFYTMCCNDVWHPFVTLLDYASAALLVVNFLAFRVIGQAFVGSLRLVAKPIRWLASMTFSLYLFHLPLLQMFAAVSPWNRSSHIHQFYLLVATLTSVVAISSLTEQRRGVLKDWLSRLAPDGLDRRMRSVARATRPSRM